MKRYEKMTKEEILEKFHEASQSTCDDTCNFTKYCGDCNAMDCIDAVSMWLNEEIEMIPRAWTFKNIDECDDAWEKFKESNACDLITLTKCKKCKYLDRMHGCQINWLYELVEKPTEEGEA